MFLGSCLTILYMFRKSLKHVGHYFNHIGFWYLFFNSIHLLILCGDVEQNAGPKDTKYLSLCQWNLNSLAAHDFALKVSALKAFNATEKFNFIFLSESYVVPTISSDDNFLSLDGYNLIRADHPKNIKQGGVCIYYRETLPVKTVQINCLHECLVCEVNLHLYRSPSQNDYEFDEFPRSFECAIDHINQSNTYFVLITGDLMLIPAVGKRH